MSAADESLFAFRTNMVVTASAGTGKTFRLVTLYVLLTLGLSSKGQRDEDEPAPPIAPARIGATTFSRAAAAEIRERVERVLRAVANASDDGATAPYLTVLESRAKKTRSPHLASSVMRERARSAVDDLPHALIDTLHGLAGRVVRACALDLGITPAYGVLDEEMARTSVDAATEDVLSTALLRGDRSAVDLLDAGGGLAMTRRRVAELLDRADEEGIGIDELGCTNFAQAAEASLLRLRELCDRLVSEGSRTLGEPALVAASAARRWLERETEQVRDGTHWEKELAGAFEPLFERRSSPRPSPAEEAFFAFRAAIKGDTNAARARRLAAFVARAHELSPRTRAIAALLSDIAESRSIERRRAGNLGFGDLLRIARDALRDDPAVGDMARGMFDVLLVDEFQDTSRVQRDLIYLLREKRTSAAVRPIGVLPTAGDLEPAGLLVVGDRKQSIYGFRGADVTVFARVCAELAGRSASEALRLGAEFEVPETPNAALVTLFENRRSDRRILEFVNWFAGEDFDESSGYPFDIRYAESEHLVAADGHGHGQGGGGVVVVDDDGGLLEEFVPLVRGASPPMREALVAAGVVDRAVREARFGALRFGDVAILARRRATLPLLEMALARLDIPYVVAGRGLFETREVRDVFAVLRLILDPYDRHALATVLRGPAVGLSDRALALMSEPGRGLIAPDDWFASKSTATERIAQDEQERLRRFATLFRELRRLGLGLGPADAIRFAVAKLDLDQVIAALPHAMQRFGNIERLVELATQRGGSLPSFVRWLGQQIADQSDESEAAALHDADDAVTLMTIHASKGLEFRAVVLVDMGTPVRATPLSLELVPARLARPARLAVRHVHERGGSLFTPEAVELAKENVAREVAERRRLSYVAMTRARDRLFLVVPPSPGNGSAAVTMRRLLPSIGALAGTQVESAIPYLLISPPSPGRAASEPRASIDVPPFHDRAASSSGPLGISMTQLATFEQCPRRYRFIHELALDPPPFESEPPPHGTAREERRALGTAAHALLERWPLSRWGEPTKGSDIVAQLVIEGRTLRDTDAIERVSGNIAAFLGGSYAARLRATKGAVYREEKFVMPLESTDGALRLRGTIDLLLTLPDGSAEIVDYKSSWRPELGAPHFQLRAYALAVRRRLGASTIRVGILNLVTDTHPALAELADAEHDVFERRLATLRGRFMLARTTGNFGGVERSTCERLRCGFVSACHGG